MGFLGWSSEQWAIAAGRYPESAICDIGGKVDFKDAIKLKGTWDKLNYADPGEIDLGIEICPAIGTGLLRMARDAPSFRIVPPPPTELKPNRRHQGS